MESLFGKVIILWSLCNLYKKRKKNVEKVYFRSQILVHPSIGEYWNISGVPVLPENVIFTFFRTCWCYSEAYNTGTQKWSSIVQYSCTSIWDLKYTFPKNVYSYFIQRLSRLEWCAFDSCSFTRSISAADNDSVGLIS